MESIGFHLRTFPFRSEGIRKERPSFFFPFPSVGKEYFESIPDETVGSKGNMEPFERRDASDRILNRSVSILVRPSPLSLSLCFCLSPGRRERDGEIDPSCFRKARPSSKTNETTMIASDDEDLFGGVMVRARARFVGRSERYEE